MSSLNWDQKSAHTSGLSSYALSVSFVDNEDKWDAIWENATDEERELLEARLREFQIAVDATPQEKWDAIERNATGFEKCYCRLIASRRSSNKNPPLMRTPKTATKAPRLSADILETLDKQSGKRIVFPSGDIYEGDTVNELPEGEGKMTFRDGTIYTGEWKDGKKHGKGKKTFATDSIYREYDGEWEDDKRHVGKMTYKNGEVYNCLLYTSDAADE